ncbi:hypothetical protein [Leeuwenhoekiella sp. NPDC079379]
MNVTELKETEFNGFYKTYIGKVDLTHNLVEALEFGKKIYNDF